MFTGSVPYSVYRLQIESWIARQATNLLPQILKKRQFRYEQVVQGLRLILWGMFKKVVIADSLSPMVHHIFSNIGILDGGTLF